MPLIQEVSISLRLTPAWFTEQIKQDSQRNFKEKPCLRKIKTNHWTALENIMLATWCNWILILTPFYLNSGSTVLGYFSNKKYHFMFNSDLDETSRILDYKEQIQIITKESKIP